MKGLPNLKKHIREDKCAVMRCKAGAEMTYDVRNAYPNVKGPISLCTAHFVAISDCLGGSPLSEQTEAVPAMAQHDANKVPAQADEGVQAMLAVLADRSVRDQADEDLRKRDETLMALRALPIRSQQDIDSADAILHDIKGRLKWYKDQKTAARRPFNEQLKRVSLWFDPAIEFYSEAEKAVKVRIRDGRAELDRERNAALQAAAQAHQAGDTQTVQAMVQAANTAETHLPKGMYQVERYSFQVNSPDMVPREFCSPDPAKIRAHAQRYGTTMPIPGVTIWPDDIMGQRR